MTRPMRIFATCNEKGLTTVRVLMRHDMETGFRKKKDGTLVPSRAARAQAEVVLLDQPPFADGPAQNLVFCDMPCSGSGVWRRDPSGKWTLTAARLRDLQNLQSEILGQASALVASGGMLLYAT